MTQLPNHPGHLRMKACQLGFSTDYHKSSQLSRNLYSNSLNLHLNRIQMSNMMIVEIKSWPQIDNRLNRLRENFSILNIFNYLLLVILLSLETTHKSPLEWKPFRGEFPSLDILFSPKNCSTKAKDSHVGCKTKWKWHKMSVLFSQCFHIFIKIVLSQMCAMFSFEGFSCFHMHTRFSIH
jgi:hypothetical protein